MEILIKENLKNYGKDKSLWYHPFQNKSFQLFMDTKQGYLVFRDDVEDTRKWLVKHKHGEELYTQEELDEIEAMEEEEKLDDEIV